VARVLVTAQQLHDLPLTTRPTESLCTDGEFGKAADFVPNDAVQAHGVWINGTLDRSAADCGQRRGEVVVVDLCARVVLDGARQGPWKRSAWRMAHRTGCSARCGRLTC